MLCPFFRYVDGHEREDVVKERERYCAEMKVYQLFMNEYGGNLLMHVVRRPMVLLNGKRIVLVSHDETVLHQNDGTRWSYREKGHENMPLQQKAMGVGLHVSGFLSEDVGVIEITDDEWQRYLASLPTDEARKRAQPNEFHDALAGPLQANIKVLIGKAHATAYLPSGYWTGEHVLKQLEHAVTLFEIKHPGCIGLFQFDNSTGHSKLASDALLTSSMGLNPGGQVLLPYEQYDKYCLHFVTNFLLSSLTLSPPFSPPPPLVTLIISGPCWPPVNNFRDRSWRDAPAGL